jgi:CMP/dCMP kinase
VQQPKIIIAIDGYSACGKSTTAKAVATQLHYAYLDTGAMYRAVTLFFLQHYVSLTNPVEVSRALADVSVSFKRNEHSRENEVYLNGLNVETEIRKLYVSDNVSEVSALAEVRHAMVSQQQQIGRKKGVVMDGRDIGTRVFPTAELKIFMTSDMEVRTRRRQEEFLAKGQLVDMDEVRNNLAHRDLIDTTRKESPLIQAPDALLVDNTHLSVSEQVDYVLSAARERIILLANLESAEPRQVSHPTQTSKANQAN